MQQHCFFLFRCIKYKNQLAYNKNYITGNIEELAFPHKHQKTAVSTVVFC